MARVSSASALEFRIAHFHLLCFDVLSQSHSWENVDISVDGYTLDRDVPSHPQYGNYVASRRHDLGQAHASDEVACTRRTKK
jgi:hypothetical protein